MYTVSFDFDHSPEDPNDQEQSWTVHSFNRRHNHFTDPDSLDHESIQDKLKRGYAFPLSYHEHGNCLWTLGGEGHFDEWDSTRFAGLIVWENDESNITSEDRKADARAHLEEYTAWCNGEVYAWSITDNEGEHVESCSGFYSSCKDDMLSEIHAYTAGHLVNVSGPASYLGDGYDFTTPRKDDGVTEFRIGDCKVYCETLRKVENFAMDDDGSPVYRCSVCHAGYEFEVKRTASIKDHETLCRAVVNMLIEAAEHESDFIEKSSKHDAAALKHIAEIIDAGKRLAPALQTFVVTV